MMMYILKTVICSAFFLGIYYVLLERAKMPRFNRAYLLLSLIASFIIPLITFVTEVTVLPVFQHEITGSLIQEAPVVAQYDTPEKTGLLPFIIPGIYFLVAGSLLIRFMINISRLLLMIRRNPIIAYASCKVVLLKEQVVPFSFFHYVFTGANDYNSGNVEAEVMHHELEHVKQKHSIDIVFIELLRVVAWFNPFLFLYRRSIQLNHEFLADDAVISRFNDPFAYQVLLLNKISQANHFYPVSSPFSYKITKKRLTMITNPFDRKTNMVRALTVIPCITLAVFLFSERIIAQVPSPDNTDRQPLSESPAKVLEPADTTKPPQIVFAFPFYGGTKEGVSPELMKEYEDLIKKYETIDSKKRGALHPPDEAKNRMKEIFAKMSREQQSAQDVAFLAPIGPLQKITPSEAMMQSFLDETKYGIWIDNKRATNASLSNYKNTDFSYVTISKLYGAAKKGRSYTHQVDMMTNAFFTENNARRLANKEPHMVFTAKKKKP